MDLVLLVMVVVFDVVAVVDLVEKQSNNLCLVFCCYEEFVLGLVRRDSLNIFYISLVFWSFLWDKDQLKEQKIKFLTTFIYFKKMYKDKLNMMKKRQCSNHNYKNLDRIHSKSI
jgi:hypothetical protein